MKNPNGLIMMITGIALMIFGFHECDSIKAGFSHIFSGSPSNKEVWLIIAGVIAVGCGGRMMTRENPKSR